jgi:endonuclease/exonuclease/phosphatase family metal-dependent hydrolase
LAFEDEEMEDLYGVIIEILEEDGKGATNTIIMGDLNSVAGDRSYQSFFGQHGFRRRIREVKCSLTFVKEIDL